MSYRILILGASYGSLLGAKIALAGHDVDLVCLPEEADLINSEGAIVRLPARGVEGLVELNSKNMPGRLSAGGTTAFTPADYDLIVLAMQEPQYSSAGVKDLTNAVSASGIPCMSIMNMPPLTYLRRFDGIDAGALTGSYTDPTVWDSFDPALMTLCSPDPQAFRPPADKMNVLQVGLPTNFKAARFESDAHTAIIEQLAADIQAIRYRRCQSRTPGQAPRARFNLHAAGQVGHAHGRQLPLRPGRRNAANQRSGPHGYRRYPVGLRMGS
jgi:hypothetical protein